MLEHIVVLSLISWRLASLLHSESVFDWLRKLLKIDQNGSDYPADWFYPKNWIGEVFSCFWCLSLWSSILLALALVQYPWWTRVVLGLAGGTGAIITEKWIGRSKARW